MATPSLALFPSGRKATKLYSVLPTDGTGDFTVARAGLRNEINSDLKLSLIAANVPAFNYDTLGGCPVLNTEPQATNLITYPISFGNSYWTKSGATIEGDASTAGSEIIAGTLVLTDGSGWDYNFGSVTFSGAGASFNANDDRLVKTTLLTVGQLYLCEVNITTNTATRFDIDNNGAPIYKSSTSTGVQSFYFTASSASFRIVQVGAGAVVVASLSVKAVQGYSAPSVDFPTSAFKLVESATNAIHTINITTPAVGSDYSLSIFAKAGERRYISLAFSDLVDWLSQYTFDLTDGVLTDTYDYSGVTSTFKSEALADGWYKLSLSSNYTFATTVYTRIFIEETATPPTIPANSYLGDGTSGVYVFMAQVETGSVATSPTFTDITLAAEGSTTTRLADIVSISAVNSTAWDFTSEDFSFVFDVNIKYIPSSSVIYCKGAYIVSGWYFEIKADGAIRVRSNQSGVVQVTDSSAGTIVADVDVKIVVTRSGASVKIYKDGVDVTFSSGTHIDPVSASAKDLYLGTYDGGGDHINGNISAFDIYNTKLTPTQVANL